jgi:hypothetical protein
LITAAPMHSVYADTMTQAPYPQRRPQPPPPAGRPFETYETRRDVEAALAARQELGPEYSDHIAAGLADRVEQLAAIRTAELRFEAEREGKGSTLERGAQTQRFVTALASIVAGIPISIVGMQEGSLTGTAICWAGIVGVNMAQALATRRRK